MIVFGGAVGGEDIECPVTLIWQSDVLNISAANRVGSGATPYSMRLVIPSSEPVMQQMLREGESDWASISVNPFPIGVVGYVDNWIVSAFDVVGDSSDGYFYVEWDVDGEGHIEGINDSYAGDLEVGIVICEMNLFMPAN